MNTIKVFKKGWIRIVLLVVFLGNSTSFFGQTMVSTTGKNTYSFTTSGKNGAKTYRVKNSNNDFKIEYEGEITLSDDDKDVIGISMGGFLEIKKTSFGSKRRILIHAEEGTLVKKYYKGWSKKPYNPTGKAWLAAILPEIVRTTTIAAEARVNRFYKKGGANSVLSEVREIKSDYVKIAYIKLLLKKNLSTKELVSVLKSTGKNIKSDYYVSQILKNNQNVFLKNGRTVTAYIDAALRLKSDHYLSEVIKTVINNENISDKQLDSLLEATKGIKSDHYLTQVLKELMKRKTLNAKNITKVLEITSNIKSDYYKTEIFKKVLLAKNLSDFEFARFLTSLKSLRTKVMRMHNII